MKIAIDVSPLQSGHKIRGVGFYLEYLKRSLLEYFPQHTYNFFTTPSEIEKDVDVLHYPYFDPFFLTLPSSQKFKTIVTVHDLTPIVFKNHFPAGIKGNIKWQIQKYRLKKVNAIIADSQVSKDDIVRITGIAQQKISVAYLAAGKEFQILKDEKVLKAVKSKYQLPEKFVLYVGDVTWNKNIPNLLKAVQKADLPMVMVGKSLVNKGFDKSNPWNSDLIEAQSLIEKNKQITTLGFIPTEDLVALYNCATVFAFPSLYEGFGLPVIEAMQSGCPVITTKGGSLLEVAGNAAEYIDGQDVQNIADGLSKVFFDEHIQKDLSEKGLIQAKKFSWKKTAEETIKVYEKTR